MLNRQPFKKEQLEQMALINEMQVQDHFVKNRLSPKPVMVKSQEDGTVKECASYSEAMNHLYGRK